MKQIVATLLLWIVLFFSACKKDVSCELCQEEKKPPVSNAGVDRNVILPKDSIHVDGSTSTDPDGNVVSYRWEQITGPSSTVISTPAEAKTAINAFQLGSYQFQLTVTDNDGLQAKDTLQVLVTDPAINQPPVAHAGTDFQIPISNIGITLDGTNSYDPDGVIKTYKWVNLTSQLNAEIVQPDSARTNVKQLAIGIYQFQLTVTDDNGLLSKDTVVVTITSSGQASVDCNGYAREMIPATLTHVATLPTYRGGIKAAVAANKIVFPGGSLGIDLYNKIDVYDLGTKTWTTTDLPFPAEVGGTAVLGNKVYVCIYGPGIPDQAAMLVFDAAANNWTTIDIANYKGRTNIDVVAAAGNKVVVVSGTKKSNVSQASYTVADIFNTETNQWRTDTIHTRTHAAGTHIVSDAGIAATTVGNQIWLAGGASSSTPQDGLGSFSSTVDVYNTVSDEWTSSSNLSRPRGIIGQITVDNKIYWAGGFTSDGYTDLVEIRNLSSGSSAFSCLSGPRTGISAVLKDNKIIFIGDHPPDDWQLDMTFDIYDITTNTWSIGILPKSIGRASVFMVDNTIYVAGGYTGYAHDYIYTLEF